MSRNNTINILICFDDLDWNYARHCAVTMLSILETNKMNKIKFYIISTCLSEDNIKELNRIVNEYNQEIEFIIRDNVIPENIKSILINSGNLTRWTRYRLFFNLYIKNIDRILYLDCDAIITKDLSKIYNMDMKWKTIVGYYEVPALRYRKKNLDTDHYINVWVLLIDVKKYNQHPITTEEIKSINKKYGKKLNFDDEDYLNVLFRDEILIYEQWMNYLLTRPFFNKWLSRATILHCVFKPYFKYTICPQKAVKLYYEYLDKTKWKWFPKIRDKSLLKYIWSLLYFFVIFWIEKVWWGKWIARFDDLKITEKLRKLFRIKSC